MEITLKAVDEVMERTGCSYAEAKDVLIKADGDVLDAIILFESNQSVRNTRKDIFEGSDRTVEQIVEKVKDLIEEGTAVKFLVRDRYNSTVVSIPLTAGIALGTVAVLTTGPLVLIAGLVAKYGMEYRFVVVRKDGSEVTL